VPKNIPMVTGEKELVEKLKMLSLSLGWILPEY
jgi:hypothetical protein